MRKSVDDTTTSPSNTASDTPVDTYTISSSPIKPNGTTIAAQAQQTNETSHSKVTHVGNTGKEAHSSSIVASNPDILHISKGQQISINNTRSRRDRPCDACRRRKSRCVLNEGSDVCVLCRFHSQNCTFVQSPLPRKRRLATTPGAERKSEKGRARDNEKSEGGSGKGPGNAKKSRPSTELESPKSSRTSCNRRHSSLSPPGSTDKNRDAQPIDDYSKIEGPSLLKRTLGLQKHRHSRLCGNTSEYEATLIDLCPFDLNDEYEVGHPQIGSTFRRVLEDEYFIMLQDQENPDSEFDQELEDVDAIEACVAPHGQTLINLYFRIVHPSFPILHKKVFLEKYTRTHREFAPPLLAAVYILALNWWKYDSELSKIDKSQQPDLQKLERLANKCMADVVQRPKLSTVQAGLLLLQKLGAATSSGSWALTAQLVAVGQELGLHLDCTDWRIPAWEKGLRRRLAWALFMQDKWGALTHGRPSHITGSNWAVRPVSPEDFPETARDEDDDEGSSEVEKGRLLFMETIKLTEITGEILDGFFTVEAGRYLDGKISRVLERAKPMQIKLKEWHSRLPDELRMDAPPRVRKLDSNGYLHLAYFATEITLHRQILRTLSPPPSLPQPPNIDPYLLHICRSAAKTRLISAMDFVNRLKPEHLQSFWYFASKVNFALIGTFGSLLWATSPNVAEAEFYKARLAEYRWTLRVSAKGAEFMEFAVGVLDIGIGRVQQDEWKQKAGRAAVDGGTVGVGEGVGLGMLGLGMGGHDSGMGNTGTGVDPVQSIARLTSHMSPPITGDEMEHDYEGTDDDDDEDDDDEGNHMEFLDGDVDMEFAGESRYDPDDTGDDSSDDTATSPVTEKMYTHQRQAGSAKQRDQYHEFRRSSSSSSQQQQQQQQQYQPLHPPQTYQQAQQGQYVHRQVYSSSDMTPGGDSGSGPGMYHSSASKGGLNTGRGGGGS